MTVELEEDREEKKYAINSWCVIKQQQKKRADNNMEDFCFILRSDIFLLLFPLYL